MLIFSQGSVKKKKRLCSWFANTWNFPSLLSCPFCGNKACICQIAKQPLFDNVHFTFVPPLNPTNIFFHGKWPFLPRVCDFFFQMHEVLKMKLHFRQNDLWFYESGIFFTVLWLFIILKPISCNRSAWKMRSFKFNLDKIPHDRFWNCASKTVFQWFLNLFLKG